jgi:hypothetical protein
MYPYSSFCNEALSTITSGYINRDRVQMIFGYENNPKAYLVAAIAARNDGTYHLYIIGGDMQWSHFNDFATVGEALNDIQSSSLTSGMKRLR